MDNKKLYSIKWKQSYNVETSTTLLDLLAEKLEQDRELDLNNSGFEEARLVIDRIKNLR